MVTQNYFSIPATVLEKFKSRGFPEGVTLTADHCKQILLAAGAQVIVLGFVKLHTCLGTNSRNLLHILFSQMSNG